MDPKTREIIDIFNQINAVPRCSKNETAVSNRLLQWAHQRGFEAVSDNAGNLLITVPASPGAEQAPTVVLQGHMDMVCEKTPDSGHDFTKDPIKAVIQGDWITADQTTLGADNGIGLAIAMAIAVDPGVVHPPLELLFTVDEETGLNGAKKIPPGFFKGKIYLNIDSETEGVFTVGCAGGKDLQLSLPLKTAPVPPAERFYQVTVGGLSGGHSGIDIHKQRANANLLLARVLKAVFPEAAVRIAKIIGGSAHNAIPRDAKAVLTFAVEKESRVRRIVENVEKAVRSDFFRTDPSARISLEPAAAPSDGEALSVEDTVKAVRLLMALPHGVAGMSADIEGLVETSSNLATVHTEDRSLRVLTSQRSAVPSKLEEISGRIEAVAALAGAVVEIRNAYPAWPPDLNSPLLARCRKIYRELFGKTPGVEAIHAGLECAVIGAKFEGVDMISFGPDMENPHSPDERLHIPSIAKIREFTAALLASYAKPAA